MAKLNLCREVLENAIGVHRNLEKIEPLLPLDAVAVQAMEELLEYRQLEEQGLLLRLPVAIGSTLYQKRKDNMIEFKTIGIIYDILSKEWLYEVAVQSGVDWIKTVCSMECVGKTVFITREEAEQALMQMGE